MGGGRLGQGRQSAFSSVKAEGKLQRVLKKVKTVVLSNRAGTTGVVSTLSL
jgi:hypothetical protein